MAGTRENNFELTYFSLPVFPEKEQKRKRSGLTLMTLSRALAQSCRVNAERPFVAGESFAVLVPLRISYGNNTAHYEPAPMISSSRGLEVCGPPKQRPLCLRFPRSQ